MLYTFNKKIDELTITLNAIQERFRILSDITKETYEEAVKEADKLEGEERAALLKEAEATLNFHRTATKKYFDCLLSFTSQLYISRQQLKPCAKFDYNGKQATVISIDWEDVTTDNIYSTPRVHNVCITVDGELIDISEQEFAKEQHNWFYYDGSGVVQEVQRS
jgi:hypothetical protein